MIIMTLLSINLRCWLLTCPIHGQESNFGSDKTCLVRKPTGEIGEFQIRPIFERDIKRITNGRFAVNPSNSGSSRVAVYIWLKHYLPRAEKRHGRRMTTEEVLEMYRTGYSGYCKKKGI